MLASLWRVRQHHHCTSFLNKKPKRKQPKIPSRKTSATNPTRFQQRSPFFKNPPFFRVLQPGLSEDCQGARGWRLHGGRCGWWPTDVGEAQGRVRWVVFDPGGKFFESRWLPKKDVCFCSPDLSVSDTISLWPQRKKWIKHSSPIKTHFPCLLLLKCFFGLCQIFFWWVVSSQKFTI